MARLVCSFRTYILFFFAFVRFLYSVISTLIYLSTLLLYLWTLSKLGYTMKEMELIGTKLMFISCYIFVTSLILYDYAGSTPSVHPLQLAVRTPTSKGVQRHSVEMKVLLYNEIVVFE